MQSQITASSHSSGSTYDYPAIEKNDAEEGKKQPVISPRPKKEIHWMPEQKRSKEGRQQDREVESNDERRRDLTSDPRPHSKNSDKKKYLKKEHAVANLRSRLSHDGAANIPKTTALKTTLDTDTSVPQVTRITAGDPIFYPQSVPDTAVFLDGSEISTATARQANDLFGPWARKELDPVTAQIMACAKKNDLESMKSLIKLGGMLDCRDADDRTPLMLAAMYGHADMVRWLLDHKAQPDLTDKNGNAALHLVCGGDESGIDAESSADTANSKKLSREDQIEIVERLIDSRAYVDLQNDFGETPLKTAACLGNIALIDVLMDAGANVNSKDSNYKTALMAVSGNKQLAAVQSLLAHKANPDLVDKNGQTALILATANNATFVAKILIDAGADVDKKDHRKWTPLMYAALAGNMMTINRLLAVGANINAKNQLYETALMMVVKSSSAQGVNMNRDVIPEHIRSAMRKQEIEMVGLLIKKGADVDCHDHQHWTPLMHAASLGNSELAALLIEEGADIDAVNDKKETPLMLAAACGRADAVKRLMSAGARRDLSDNEGRTAVLHAAQNGHVDVVKSLLSNV